MNRPLDNILNSYNHDQLHEIPLSAYISKGSQHLARGLNRCGTPKALAVTFALLPSVATTCVAVIETVASLAYAIFTTALHTLTFFQIDSLQNHVIKSWAFVRHSFLMIGAPFILLANTDNLDSESINLRTAFMRLNCAQTAQTIGTVFDALGCRCAHRSVSDLADERAMGAAIESLPKLFEIIEPNSFFNQQKVINFFTANKDSLSNAEEFLMCCRLNDPNKEAFVKDLLTAYKVHHQNDFFGNEDDVLPSPRPLVTYNREKGDEAFNNPLNAYPYGRDIYPPRPHLNNTPPNPQLPLNHKNLFPPRPNINDEMNPFDLQALARRLEAEENAKMAAEEAESLRLAKELQDQFDLDDHEAEQRELNNRRQQLEAQRQAQEAEIRRRILLLQQQQLQVNQVNNAPQFAPFPGELPIPPMRALTPPEPVQVAQVIPVQAQAPQQSPHTPYLFVIPPSPLNNLGQFIDPLAFLSVKSNDPRCADEKEYIDYIEGLAEKAAELWKNSPGLKNLLIPSDIKEDKLNKGLIPDEFYTDDHFASMAEALEDAAILTLFLELMNSNKTVPKGFNQDRHTKMEALKNKINAFSEAELKLFFLCIVQRNYMDKVHLLELNHPERNDNKDLVERMEQYISYVNNPDKPVQKNFSKYVLESIMVAAKDFNKLDWASYYTDNNYKNKFYMAVSNHFEG